MFVNQQMAKRNSNGRIVIKSSDDDVLLLSLHFYSKIQISYERLPASTHVSTSELARFVKIWYFVVFCFRIL
jgi:hypothetical protein